MRARPIASVLAIAATVIVGAQQTPPAIDPALLADFSWRQTGPVTAGRVTSIAGVASQPHVFYAGSAGGGIWKSDDAGVSWQPIFDGSIGAVAVAPSNANVIYAGTGAPEAGDDAPPGTGVYRSMDAGRTWVAIGLRQSDRIARVAVHPTDPNRVLVAALGRAFSASDERGVFRSIDGGKTFTRVLHRDDTTGAADVVIDPARPDDVYAVMTDARHAPWHGTVFSAGGTSLHKSTDGGATWRQIGRGLPPIVPDARGSIAVAVNGPRVYATVVTTRGGELYRSDDGGESFTLVNGTIDVAGVAILPGNPDVVYAAGDVPLRSADGGKSFTPLWPQSSSAERAPVAFWINPAQPDIVGVASGHGARVSLNGGRSWSATAALPAARFSRVTCAVHEGIVDQGAPEHACPVADTSDRDVRFHGAVTRVDLRTGQRQHVGPAPTEPLRLSSPPPLFFAPLESKTLYFAGSSVWKTSTAGTTWTAVSGDLSRETWDVPASVGVYRALPAASPARRGAVSALAASFVDTRTLWAGTDDGLMHVTRDAGTTWRAVTPPDVTAWARIATIEASHFDAAVAYAAIDASRLDDRTPRLFKTLDGGATWRPITSGLPAPGVVHAVREDAMRRGLLFAGTDHGVFVSFDDGERWQPLQFNLPRVTVRDVVIDDASVVVATYGRGVWVLDDIAPLRQLTPDVARADAFLFRPASAWRTRATGAGAPPDALLHQGVVFSYLLGAAHSGEVSLEVIDTASGETIRRFSSDVTSTPRMAAAPGLHRVVWDARFAPPPGQPLGMLAPPGVYQLRLTVGSKSIRQPVVVRLDPRARSSPTDLAASVKLLRAVDDMLRRLGAARDDAAKRSDNAAVARLDAAATPLRRLFAALIDSDARPTAAQESAAAEALKHAAETLR